MITEYKQSKSILSKLVVFILGIIVIWFGGALLFGGGFNGDDQIFSIDQGESIDAISNRLHEHGFIKSSFAFKSYIQATDSSTSIKAGDHLLTFGMSVKEIVAELNTAAAEQDLRITILEGWSNVEIAEYLEENLDMGVNDFMAATLQNRSTYSWLPSRTLDDFTQGYLFPDTYRILPASSPNDIVVKLLDTFAEKVYEPLAVSIDRSSMTLHEILTLASIIEEEVRSEADRKLVADLFLRRLADNYPLQSDATVNYITKSGRAQSTIVDTKIDSPYNTYKYAGLPPGPIGNPSLSSIEAVLNPLPNTYYFFLTTKDDGRVMYGKTYEEHLQNKAKYLD